MCPHHITLNKKKKDKKKHIGRKKLEREAHCANGREWKKSSKVQTKLAKMPFSFTFKLIINHKLIYLSKQIQKGGGYSFT